MAKTPISIQSEAQKLLVTGNVIFLYGYIGNYSGEAEAQANENRDLDFVTNLEALCQRYPSVDVRINSNGGSVTHGSAMMSAIQRNADKVHTYNDGMCASIAADIWMCAKKENRHMAKNASLLVHSPWGCISGTPSKIRKYADYLEKLAEGTIVIMAEATGKTASDIKALYYDDEQDHTFSTKDCVEMGLVAMADEYEAAEQKMDADTDAHKYFDDLQSLMVAQLESASKQRLITHHQKKEDDMNFQELAQKAAKGELTADELAQLKSATAAAEQAAAANKTYTAADIEAARQTAEAAKNAEIEALKAQLAVAEKRTSATEPQARIGEIDPQTPPIVPIVVDEAQKAAEEVNRLLAEGHSYLR